MGVLGAPSAASFLVAVGLWVLVAWVPGILVAGALSPRLTLLQRLAVAPLISLGVGFSAGAWAQRAGAGDAVDIVLVALVVATIAAAIVHVRRRSAPALRLRRAVGDRSNQVVLAAVGAAVLQWMVAIALSVPGFSSVAPNSDGNAHGARVARMLLTGSVDPYVVNAFDLASPTSASEFYPLGVHSLAAQVARVAGTGTSLLVALTLVASVSLCLGSAALGRMVGGARTGAAAAVAAAVLLPFATFGQLWWGPVPFQVAMASVPALAVVVLAVRRPGGLVVAAVAWAGMLGLHLTEALVAGVLVGLTLLLAPGDLRTRLRSLLPPAASAVVGALLAAPTVLGILTAGVTAPQDPSPGQDPLSAVLHELLHPFLLLPDAATAVQALILLAAAAAMCVTCVGCVVAWRRPEGRALVLTYLAVAMLGIAAYMTLPGLLAVPWYGNGDRITAQAAGLLPVLLGTGALVAVRVGSGDRGRRVALWSGATVVVLALVGQVLVAVPTALSSFSVVTSDDRAAFAWLAAHTDAGRRVLNDNRDGSPWMYDATHGVAAPVFAIKPGALFIGDPAFAGRLRLRDTIARIASDPVTQDEARRWAIQYVMVGSRPYPGVPPLVPDGPDPAGLRLVFRSGDARVYAVEPTP